MIKLSLRAKFLLVTVLLLVSAVASYLFLAVSLFNEDKTTFVYEGNAALVGTLASQTEVKLKAIEQTVDLLALTSSQTFSNPAAKQAALSRIFKAEPTIVEFTVFNIPFNATPVTRLVNDGFLTPYKLRRTHFEEVRKKARIDPAEVLDRGPIVQNVSISEKLPLLGFFKVFSSNKTNIADRLIVALLRQDNQIELFSRSQTFTTYLIDSFGGVLVHPAVRKVTDKISLANSNLVGEILQSKFEKGVKATKDKGRDVIYGFARVGFGDLIVVSEIERSKAFLASQRLIEKSIYFALLIISVALVVSILFAKQITASISRLVGATQEIMKGNFLVSVDVKSSDEVGVLSQSFNRMTSEISRLMDETADKARMEKELETAQLVQDNFFPIDQIEIGNFEVAAFYRPASECGGDWWGHIQMNDKVVILIGDATGHGVPSALITAAAQSCCSTLEQLHKNDPLFDLSPGSILELLNNAIYKGGRGHVKMTFFAGVIDTSTGTMRYANASHDMPLICHANPEDVALARSKKDVEVCKGKTGLILGQQAEASFPEHTVKIEPGGVLALFTDGILECKNREEQMYGKGRFLRAFYKNANADAKNIRDTLVGGALEFFGDRERDDDVTLVVVKHRELAVPKIDATAVRAS